MKSCKRSRILAALTVLILLLACPTLSAYGADESGNSQTSARPYIPSNANALVLMDAGAQSPKAAPGKVVEIVLPIAVNREYLPTERYLLRNISIEPVIPADRSKIDQWPFDLINASYVRHLDDMTFNSTATVYYEFRISHLAKKGVYPVNFKITATVWRDDDFNGSSIEEDVTFELGVYVTVTDDGGDSGVVSGIGPLNVSGTTDGRGTVDTPTGRPGQTVTLYIPVINKGGKLTEITVSPVISNSVEEFPFVAEELNYGKNLADMKSGTEVTLDYTFRVSPYATTGNKSIKFRATYRENGVYGECTFTSYIYIENGYEEIVQSAPVVTITGYELLADGRSATLLMAGEEAILRVFAQNNSESESVRKAVATITPQNQEALMLTGGSSDTVYVDRLEPGEVSRIDFHVTARASAPVGPTAVGIDIKYENGEALAGSAKQSIMIPVKQPIRLAVDDPVIYGEQKSGVPIAVNVNIVNMGRAKLFNFSIVAVDGVGMYESFYGGDLLPAGTLNADIQVISQKTGSFTGRLLVSYEDNDGEMYTEEIALPMNIPEDIILPEQAEDQAAAPISDKSDALKNTGIPGGITGAALGLTALGGGSGSWYYLKIFRRRRK